MGSIHAAGEWLRLSEHYRGMKDGELIAIARDRSKLTEIAQQILAQFNKIRNVVAHRCALNEDETTRFKLLVKDWFRIQS